ncbi:NADH-quinone oxidoreductase subunit M [Patulibacter minatonensis]|uniref:NADH-quinone oxidoreductase subunit M n=1 Tax=Patulibacter minatonensis TaxID=298163 RepID=UPI0004B55C9F|nr:NADH-quinone oxidoreductase subunit M [Patulibacter minatonensis]
MLHLSILLWLPALFGLLGLLVPARHVRWVGVLGAVLALAFSIVLVLDFEPHGSAFQHVTDTTWISALGVRYQLAVTGLNVWLVLLTTVGFAFSSLWIATTSLGTDPRAKHVILHLGIAQTAVLGALLAQDLILFVAFFDLMLIPFFFLTAQFGNGTNEERVRATIKMIVYTLVGSLLMLVAAIAVGVLATPDGQAVSYNIQEIAQRGVPEGSQGWLFACFAAAFLVKMPAFPIHGWLADGYKAMPLPILAVFSGVLSKVAVYGFLQIALPILPQGTADLRWVVLILAVLSILYASSLALTTFNARLVLAYSSVAQLGFITLGVMSLRPDGASGALLQSVNHGVAVFGAFLAVAILGRRTGGSEDLRDMGGAATKMPVFAVLFIVVTYAVLAMPGTANFVGEFLILRGAWEGTAQGLAIVASLGVALAAVYALRLFIRGSHNRVAAKVEPREGTRPELALMAIPVVLIAALAFHPQQTVKAADDATTRAVQRAAIVVGPDHVRKILEADPSARNIAPEPFADVPPSAGTVRPIGGARTTGPASQSDPATDPNTGRAVGVDPSTGQATTPSGGAAGSTVQVDPSTGQTVDPSTGQPVEPPSAQTEGAGR